MVVFNNPGYYHALDRTFSQEEYGPPQPQVLDDGSEWQTKLGPKELGTSANPMQNQVQALQAKIREGASRVELEFPGAGKGSSQSPTPESYGKKERRDIRELARATGIKTSTHATFQKQGFSGFDPQRGFNDEQRYQNIKEVKKAIEFAAEATTGGAVVFHTGEFQRPISEFWGNGYAKGEPHDAKFRGYEEEEERATHYMVDDRTGDFVSAIKKDKRLYRPKYHTANTYNLSQDRVGKYDEKKGDVLEADDWIDMNGNYVDPKNPDRLFERVPVWNEDKTNFEVEEYDWKRIEDETKHYNQKYGTDLRPERLFVQIEEENKILQAKGHSLFYAHRYNDLSFQAKKIREALEFYRGLDESLPKEEKWKLMTERGLMYGKAAQLQLATAEQESIPDLLQRELKDVQDNMRHTHEASSAADAQAVERQQVLNHMKPVHEYGLEKSTEGIARAGMFAYEQTEKNKKQLKDPVYVAPENWQTQMFGGHPDEMIQLVQGARKDMAKKLVEMRGKSADEAKKLAKDHIKSTIDIGHLNLWRQHFVSKPGENEDSRNQRFNKWAVDKTKKMIKAGIVGHVHIADNLGWDDEHLTPGEGNAPIKEFVKEMEKAGIKDFIIEPGSFNPQRALPDTLRYLGSPVYAAGTPMSKPFGHFREAHFGYNAPSNYIVGAYSPSNEWKLWSEVPLE